MRQPSGRQFAWAVGVALALIVVLALTLNGGCGGEGQTSCRDHGGVRELTEDVNGGPVVICRDGSAVNH